MFDLSGTLSSQSSAQRRLARKQKRPCFNNSGIISSFENCVLSPTEHDVRADTLLKTEKIDWTDLNMNVKPTRVDLLRFLTKHGFALARRLSSDPHLSLSLCEKNAYFVNSENPV